MEKGQGKGKDTLQTDNVYTRKEYIEREAACALMPDDYYGWRDKQILNFIHAADVVPVRHGRWIKDCDRVMGDGWTYTQRHCSECGGQTVECVNYCQFCGARMDGDGDV